MDLRTKHSLACSDSLPIVVVKRHGALNQHDSRSHPLMTLAVEAVSREALGIASSRVRIILVRHGRPAIALKPRTGHHGFRRYIDAYQDAGLDPQSAPPDELLDLVKG